MSDKKRVKISLAKVKKPDYFSDKRLSSDNEKKRNGQGSTRAIGKMSTK